MPTPHPSWNYSETSLNPHPRTIHRRNTPHLLFFVHGELNHLVQLFLLSSVFAPTELPSHFCTLESGKHTSRDTPHPRVLCFGFLDGFHMRGILLPIASGEVLRLDFSENECLVALDPPRSEGLETSPRVGEAEDGAWRFVQTSSLSLPTRLLCQRFSVDGWLVVKKGPQEVTILTGAAYTALARLDKGLNALLHCRIMPSLPRGAPRSTCLGGRCDIQGLPRVPWGTTCQGVEKEIEGRGSNRKTNVVSYFGYCIFDNLPPDNYFLA